MSSQIRYRILVAVPIESYIGRYVHLKAAGNSLRGLCPFHKEKTPSFTVSPQKGFFYCFGCNRGGDLFRFVMEREGLPFPQAQSLLARYAGIPLESSDKKSSKKEIQLLELNTKVMQTFCDFLHTPQAKPHREYLRKRRVSEESIKFFNIGASPDRWDWLPGNYPQYEKELLSLGLLRQKEKSRAPYDFFRNRIIFPILSLDKKPLGFGGRSLPTQANSGKEAKYINSSESLLFKKSRLLYGLSQNLSELRSQQTALLVEGYLDVIGLWQVGLRHACAPLGTALSMEHLYTLSFYVKSVTFLFDGDEAGLRAAQRAAALSLKVPKLQCHICLLPFGYDPFDLCTSTSASQLNLLPLLEHKIKSTDFFLMESMLPLRFQEFQNEKHQNKEKMHSKEKLSDFARTAQDYYGGVMPALLPQAMQKREALDRLYENLAELATGTEMATNCRLLLEGAAHILKLDPLELQREWNKRYQKKNHVPLYASFPSPAEKPYLGDAPPAASNLPKNTQKSLNSYEQNLVHCERQLLIELLSHPDLFGHFYERLNKLNFEDPYSEVLWRHLEDCYHRGNIWDKDNPMSLELPEESRNIFTSLIAKSQFEQNIQTHTGGGPTHKETQEMREIMEDYLLKHDILQHEKNIDKIGLDIPVADLLRKSQLIAEEGGLIRELNHLKDEWRYKLEQKSRP